AASPDQGNCTAGASAAGWPPAISALQNRSALASRPHLIISICCREAAFIDGPLGPSQGGQVRGQTIYLVRSSACRNPRRRLHRFSAAPVPPVWVGGIVGTGRFASEAEVWRDRAPICFS